jgi:hypothetical protein
LNARQVRALFWLADLFWATPERCYRLGGTTMAATEYEGYRIETFEAAGKWRASIQRTDDLEIRVGTGRYRSFRTGEFATEREAIERAHKLIDSHALV